MLGGSSAVTPTDEDNANFASLSVGPDHACGLKTDGSLACWGDNTESESDLPMDNTGFGAVAAGKNFACALNANGKVIC